MEAHHDLHVLADRVDACTAILDADLRLHRLRQEAPDRDDEVAAHQREDAGEHEQRAKRGEGDSSLRERAHVLDDLEARDPGLREPHLDDAAVLDERPVRDPDLHADGDDAFAVVHDRSRRQKERVRREQAVGVHARDEFALRDVDRRVQGVGLAAVLLVDQDEAPEPRRERTTHLVEAADLRARELRIVVELGPDEVELPEQDVDRLVLRAVVADDDSRSSDSAAGGATRCSRRL